MQNMLRLDFHCHTIHSWDSLTSPATLIRACRKRGLDRVVITDHNSIAGALIAKGLAPELVIVGEEIRTTRGEILAAYVTKEIPAGLSPQEVIRRLRAQGAFISLSHPFDPFREHWSVQEVLALLPLIDAIEVYNPRTLWPWANKRAQEFVQEHNLPGTTGSDGHAAFELGRAVMVLPAFDGADELRAAVRQMRIEVRRSLPVAFFASRYASLYKHVMRLRHRRQ